jgi:hypothetical protein
MAESLTASSGICRKPECRVTESGICSDGHDPIESCPYFDSTEDEDIEDEDELDTEWSDTTSHTEQTALPSGDVLNVEGVDEFLRWRPATLVSMVGERESGKTTLICTIYDRFLHGAFAGYSFAGSRTLIALQRRLHYARAASGRVRPDTPRTSLSEDLHFFHLALARSSAPEARSDLMLADRAGEAYRYARSNSDRVRDLIEVRKADFVVLLLDGGRIVDPVERTGAMQSVRQTLRAFIDGGAICGSSIIQIVTTKFDLVAASDEKEELERRLSEFQERLRADFEERVGHLSFWNIAARDPLGRYPLAWQVDTLLYSWLNRPSIAGVRNAPVDIPLLTEFDRLLRRTPMETVQ